MLWDKVPYILLSTIFGIVALYGKRHMVDVTTHAEKAIMAFKSMSFYLQKLALPTDLSVIYPFPDAIKLFDPVLLVPFILISLLIIATIIFARKNRLIAFGFIFFFVTVAPTFLNFAKAGEVYFASDRYAYIPSIGIFLVVTIGLGWIADRIIKKSVRGEKIFIGLISAILICFGFMAHAQSLVWQDKETLFTQSMENYGNTHVAHNNLANAFLNKGEIDKAIFHYEEAIKIKPDSVRTHCNLALALGRNGDFKRAFSEIVLAQELSPGSAESYLRLGDLFAMQENERQAKEAYAKAMELDPDYVRKQFYKIQFMEK
jgi:tetratricopeptide (TPR) repeat protein